MRSIAVMNQKGGVGKTTTAVNLSAALARSGARVGLVDLDPQAHSSLHFRLDPQPGQPSIYEVLCGQARFSEVCRQVAENFWVVGSSLDLAGAEVELAEATGREALLREKLREEPPQVDYLVVDCPPSLGILTLNALAAVDEVLIPLQPHFLALHGLSKLLETIERVASHLNERLRLCGVVLCMYDAGTRLATEVADDVEEFFAAARDRKTAWSAGRVFSTRIRRNIRLAEAPSFGQSIFEYAPQSNGAEDYAALAAEMQHVPV
jgi:chromosome partitioning protein